MTSAETKKAPVAPTTGTTTEAAPTAPNNTESFAEETDTTMIAPTTHASNALDDMAGLDAYEVVLRRRPDRRSPEWKIENGVAKHSLFTLTIREYTKEIVIDLLNPTAEADALDIAGEIKSGAYKNSLITDAVRARNLTPGERVCTMHFGHTSPIETCDRRGCERRGDSFRQGDHVCQYATPTSVSSEGVDVFFDTDQNQWAIDLEPAAQDYFTGAKANAIAAALVAAGRICDDLNGTVIRRPVEACAAPEHEGLV